MIAHTQPLAPKTMDQIKKDLGAMVLFQYH